MKDPESNLPEQLQYLQLSSIVQGIDQGLLHSFQAVDFDQRQDLEGVMSGIKMAGLQLLIILGGSVAQRQEAHQ